MLFTNFAISFILNFLIVSKGEKARVKREPDPQEERRKAEELAKKFESNNGHPTDPGSYSYFVVFAHKPNSKKDNDKHFDNAPLDDSVNKDLLYFGSGTILTRRWILTKTTPIAYYPIGNYLVLSQRSIYQDFDLVNKYEVDSILIHPDHKSGDQKTDLALAHTDEDLNFGFETRNVNIGFGSTDIPLTNCVLVVWSFIYEGDGQVRLDKGEIPFDVKDGDCSREAEFANHFICLIQDEAHFNPCRINSGAPVICNSVLVGVYSGGPEGALCDEKHKDKNYNALRMDNERVEDWLENVLSEPILSKPPEDVDNAVLRVCRRNGAQIVDGYYRLVSTILIVLILVWAV